MIVAIIVQGLLGAALIGLSHWGRSRRGRLASGWMDPLDRASREAMYLRGSLACLVIGALLLLTALAGLLSLPA